MGLPLSFIFSLLAAFFIQIQNTQERERKIILFIMYGKNCIIFHTRKNTEKTYRNYVNFIILRVKK